MDQSPMKDQGVMAQELAQPEPPLNEQQITNKETVRKTIKKYQSKISQMLKIIQKQKKQNDTLKDELKTLNDSLNNVINKVAHKTHKNSQENSRDDIVRKELDNEIKKNVILQKELLQLRAKVKIIDGTKITQMHNEIKEKDRVIEEMTNSIKTYAKVQKQQMNVDVYKREEELNHKVNSLNEEILHLKKKLNEQKRHQDLQEKSLKRQHQQIISLETKYKTTQNGMSLSPTKVQKQESSQIVQDYHKLKGNFESLEALKKATEKQLKHQIQNHKTRTKILENELQETKDTLQRKEKEISILTSRMRELQRKREHSTLEPVDMVRRSEDMTIMSGLFDQRKEFKGLVHITGNYRKFDDTQVLTLEKNYKIKKLVFSWFEEHILSLDAIYQFSEGNIKEVASFRVTHNYENIKFGEINFGQFEYIKDIEVYCGKWIEFMRIKTSREQTLQVGSDRNYTKCKKFTFDIKTNEKPIAFLGAIETKKVFGSEGKELLISFGLEIKKKQVTGRGTKFGRYPGRTEAIRKHPSKSVFESGRNDKNIVDDN